MIFSEIHSCPASESLLKDLKLIKYEDSNKSRDKKKLNT